MVLALPLALIRQGDFAGETAESADRYATLEAVTRIAPRLRVFYDMAGLQAGRWHRVLEALAKVTVPVAVPARESHRPAFHPKFVLVRFVREDRSSLLRLLCMSRNLTGDAALDVSVVLEGEVDRRTVSSGNSRLSQALRRLPDWAVNPCQGDAARDLVEEMANSVQRVHWRPPKGFRNVSVCPIGFDDVEFDPVTSRPDEHRRLVISPFLRDRRLRDLAGGHAEHVLISEEASLNTIPESTLSKYVVFRVDPQRTPGGSLHAKLYVAEGPRHRRWIIGSANATIAAAKRNAELVIELEASARGPGIEDIIRGSEESIRPMLVEYETADREVARPPEPTPLESFLREMTACRVTVHALSRSDGTYDVQVEVKPSPPITSASMRVWFHDPAYAARLDPRSTPSAVLTGVKRREISRFLTIEIADAGQILRRRMVVTVEGVDAERLAQDALASMFTDGSGIEQLRYFERLLSGSTPEVLSLTFDEDEAATQDDANAAQRGQSGSSVAAILEPLLTALEKGESAAARDPVIQSLGYLIDASRDQLPDDFLQLWESTRRLLGL